MNVVLLCDKIIRYSYYLLFALVPLVLSPWTYELFEFNKMMVTYTITVIMLTAWLVKMFTYKEIRIAKTPLDIPILLFLFSQLISSVLSIDGHVSWYGYYSRFNGGMWSLISYVILYYGFVSNFFYRQSNQLHNKSQNTNLKQYANLNVQSENNNSVITLIYFTLASAFLVALYGIAESYGIDKDMWVQDVQNRVFSTLGQPNWLAAYLVALFPISLWFTWNSVREVFSYYQVHKHKQKTRLVQYFNTPKFALWLLLSASFFWTLLLTRSRSGYVGFATGEAILIVILAIKYLRSKYNQLFISWVIVTHLLFFTTLFVTGTKVDSIDAWVTYQGLSQKLNPVQSTDTQISAETPTPQVYTKLLDIGISESTDIRAHVWKAAIHAWSSTPKTFLFGTGTETFAFAFYEFRPKEHNMTSEWDFLYNKAHNEYLNYLATTGFLGLGTYLLLLGFFIVWTIILVIINFLSIQNQKNNNSSQNIDQSVSESQHPDYIYGLSVSLFAGWITILVTNFSGFSVVIMQIFLFLFPAMIFVLKSSQPEFAQKYVHIAFHKDSSIARIGTFSVVFIGLLILINLGIGWFADMFFAKGYRANRSENYIESEPLLSVATSLRGSEPLFQDEYATALVGKANLALTSNNTAEATKFAQQAITASDKAIGTSPHNVNYWKTRTKLFYALSSYDPQLLNTAIEALEEAQRLSPNDAKISYNLAILYGRAAQVDKAVNTLRAGINIKPDYRDLYYGLYVIYSEVGKIDEAKAIAQEYLSKVDPGDAEFQKFVSEP